MNNFQGNRNVTGDFKRVLDALKGNIFRNLNVAEICRVEKKQGLKVTCKTLSEGILIVAIPSTGLQFEVGDYVLVVFCNTDFRTNLEKIQNNQSYKTVSIGDLHSKAYGVIVSVVHSMG